MEHVSAQPQEISQARPEIALPPEISRVATAESGTLELGQRLVQEGLISQSALDEALRIQNELGAYKPIGQILLDRNLLTQKQLDFILERYDKRPRLGDLMVAAGVISKTNLDAALNQQQETRLPIGETLIKLGFITEPVMRQALCTQLNIPFIDLDKIEVDRSLEKLLNRNYARKHSVLPIGKIGNTVTLAMDDPTDVRTVREIQGFSGFSINIVTSTRSAFWRAYTRLFDEDLPQGTSNETGIDLIEEQSSERDYTSQYLAVEHSRRADLLVRKLLTAALDQSATDIHLENEVQRMSIRFRIDGVLHQPDLRELQEKVSSSGLQILSRIKVLASMDIAEKRRPQDGSFRVRISRDEQMVNVDLRASIIPGYYGENAVIRILDSRNAPRSFSQLGFSNRIRERFEGLLRRPSGILLVTGPTGSGKTSTLCGALMTVYRPGIKILTAEEPIEYVYENFSQCEVNERIGNTFAGYLRAFLRHDPEVIMIGEIRDEETASMAFRAAQTGHLVLSTLHTNNAIGAIARLQGLGLDLNVLTSCLSGVLSQRLVREICPKCKQEYTPSADLLREFFVSPPTDIRWYQGRGCSHCNYTGYRGRLAVAELWTPSDEDIILINKDAPFEELQQSAIKSTILVAEDAMEKLREGRTNLEELIRMLPYSSIYQFRKLSGPASSDVWNDTREGKSDLRLR
jgi:type IV pilus assembly protein PilB